MGEPESYIREHQINSRTIQANRLRRSKSRGRELVDGTRFNQVHAVSRGPF